MDEDLYDGISDKPNLSSIERLIGTDLAIQISQDFGGRRLQIPLKPGPNSLLAGSVGLAAAEKIAQIYGGMHFDVPISIGKRAEIKALNAAGLSAPAIARKVRCGVRLVYAVRAELQDEKQISLPL